ncbi:MAG: phosphate ABC transporter substrate-binding protein [Oscillospiraceae bacterium]|nr:phosphate ABC transporter substrate-binding protein [Oscillospiraceae bacterium]
MKYFASLLLCTILFVLSLSACTASGDSVIALDGSTSMERIIGALTEGYHELDREVRINYSGTGSGAGVEAVLSGLCDIGLSSRALNEEEIKRGAQAHLIALDCIAVVVHPHNSIRNLTTAQLRRVFSGEITNWSQLGGSNAPIAVYGREAGSGTRSAFESFLTVRDKCAYTNEYGSNGDIIGNVSTNPNAIGYVSLAGVHDNVQLISIDGIICNADNVRSGIYTLQRPFLMVTDRNRTLSPQAQDFLDYAMSSSVAEYISIAGAIAPVRSNG